MPLHPEEQEYFRVFGSLLWCIRQLTTPLQTGWTASEGSVDSCGHKLWNQFPQKQLLLSQNFQHSKQTMFCRTTLYRQPPSYGTRAVPSGWSSTQADLLHFPRRDQTFRKILSWGNKGIYTQQLQILILPRRTQPLFTAKPERELHQQSNLTGNTQNQGVPINVWQTQYATLLSNFLICRIFHHLQLQAQPYCNIKLESTTNPHHPAKSLVVGRFWEAYTVMKEKQRENRSKKKARSLHCPFNQLRKWHQCKQSASQVPC